MASGGGSNDVNDIFDKYARFGKTEAQIKDSKGHLRIETKNVQKLCKESGVLDSKYPSQLLDNDIMRVIGKLIKEKHPQYSAGIKTLEKEGFSQLVDTIAAAKATDRNSILGKFGSVSGPSLAGTTGVANKETVARMTDTKHYTGAHKERFDDSGKGKGIEGRENRSDSSGYVGNYKGANTYDKTH